MTIDRESILELIDKVLAELRKDMQLPSLDELKMETPLYGSGSDMDSMALIHFVADLEEVLEKTYELNWILADERAMSRTISPFSTVGNLLDYIIETKPSK